MIRGLGIILILSWVVSILWTDREIPLEDKPVLRLFSRLRGGTRVAKWFVGIAAIYAGDKGHISLPIMRMVRRELQGRRRGDMESALS
jgi:hypothetical protein